MDLAQLRRGGDRCERGVLDLAALVLDVDERLHCHHSQRLEFADQLIDRTDLVARLPLRRLGDLQRFETALDVHAELVRRLGRERLRLGLHDVRQRGVARLVEAKVGGDDRRKLELVGFEPAVDFAGHADLAARRVELRCEGALRPAEQSREHLARGIIVVVDRLLAEDDHLRLLFAGDPGEQLGDSERLHFLVGLDQDGAVGAHCERGAKRLLRLRRADGHGDDLGRDALLL